VSGTVISRYTRWIGTYSTGDVIGIAKAGTAKDPITVRAQHVGKATISGSGGFSVGGGASYVTLSGFRLTGSRALSIPAGGSHLRITRNLVQISGSAQYWLTVAGPLVGFVSSPWAWGWYRSCRVPWLRCRGAAAEPCEDPRSGDRQGAGAG
jgi:hypothetical protein